MAPSAETFCTIMSMLTPASASARKMRAAMPGRSGTASTVAFASEVSCVTPEMIAFSSTRFSSSPIHVPSLSPNAERTWSGTPYLRAISTDLRHHHPGAGRGHLEHLLVGDPRQLQRVGDDAGVGGEHAFDVGVDLARSSERRRKCDRSRVGAAAAERRHLEIRRDALESGDEHDLVLVELGMETPRPHLDDLRLAVEGVGDDAGLRARERDGLVCQDRGSPSRTARSRCAPRRTRACRTRGGGAAATSRCASRISSSVVSPIADRTPTTRWPASRAATSRRATSLIFCVSPTDVPPNFITSVFPGDGGGVAFDSRNGLVADGRHAISRRPVSARPSVTSSAYSRSPPTGSPLASRVTRTRPRRRSAR